MTKYCKGCGVLLQNEDENALGYVPTLDASYCQRCYRIRHYGDVTINMQQGIESNATLEKINKIDGVVFWVVDLFAFEANLISRLNQKLPGKDIVMVLTKRDVLPTTLTDEKIINFVKHRLHEENIVVKDIVICGYLLKENDKSREYSSRIVNAILKYRKNRNVIFMGVANAGKSTVLNHLLASKDLTLPAHAYPELKKYSHLKGNFGTAWQNQQKEFDNIPGAILYTTNCLMPVKPSYADRVFTTEVVSYPEIVHIGEEKDFTPVIEKALALGGYTKDQHMTGINGGIQVTTGFSHGTVLSVADQVIEAVKNGDIKHFFLVGGCDGARVGRNYYTEFVKQSPADSIILTLACGKYRFNDLDLGTIGGLPRIMDMGQCNDAYSAIKVAIALAEAFECDVNELPLSMVLSWYEQKAVCILLTLLYLGIKNIHIGPTLPAFISPNVLNFLVENYGLSPIGTPEEDIKKLLNK